MKQRLLTSRYGTGFSTPRIQSRRLQSTPVRKTELPRERPHLIQRIQVFGRLDLGLPTGKEYDPRNSGRDCMPQTIERGARNLGDTRRLKSLVPREDHIRL